MSKRPAAAPVRKRPAAASRTAAVVAESSTAANMDGPCIVTEQLVLRLYNTDVRSFGFVSLHGAKIDLRDDDEKLVHLTWSPPPRIKHKHATRVDGHVRRERGGRLQQR